MTTSRKFLIGARWMVAAVAALALLLAEPRPAAAQLAECEEWTVPARRSQATNPVSTADANLTQGRDTYQRLCAACHGPTGSNDGVVASAGNVNMSCSRPLTDPGVLARSDGELFWMISEGRNPMPNTANILSDQDRWLLVRYIRTLQAQDVAP